MQRQLPSSVVAFNEVSERLLSGLAEVARSALPPGWRVTPFGSYIQGTCLPTSALDVALAASDTQDEDSLLLGASDIVQMLASTLLRTTAFTVPPSLSMEAGTAGGGTLRLLAGDFAEGKQCVKRTLALHLGDASTGRLDGLLRRLLDSNPTARVFVMLVKHWAQSRCLTGAATGSSFQMTLLAIFVLQQQGLLPPLRDFCSVEGAPHGAGSGARRPGGVAYVRSGAPSGGAALDSPGAMLLRFADTILGHAEAAAPRPRICLWTGSFVHEPADAPGPVGCGDLAASGQLLLFRERLVQELRRLKTTFHPDVLTSAQSQTLPGQRQSWTMLPEAESTAWQRAAESAATGPAYPPASTPAGFSTPSKPAGFSTPPPPHRRLARTLSPIREASDYGDASSFPPVEEPSRSIPEFPLPSLPLGNTAQAHGNLKWHIDQNWIATCTRDGNIIEAVQLDPRLGGSLGAAGWERRIGRRMHQIRIGKATREYRRWQEHFRRHGRRPGDPETPRAVVQNSKKQFEQDYSAWRISLHRELPGASATKGGSSRGLLGVSAHSSGSGQ
mmetsp:Transcript_37603/g.90225  ORF Transcript_37603/g.90225 Transcript_37603/m.90225 type:complete len:558 (+) Transcript_37603:37-1710(+)